MTEALKKNILDEASCYLHEHKEELAGKIVKYYMRYIPAYSSLQNPEFLDDIRDELLERITLIAEQIKGEREVGHISSEFFKKLVERRLIQGIPFSELLGAYIMGKNIILNALKKTLLAREFAKEEIFQFFNALTDATESVLIPMALTYEDSQAHLDALTGCYNHSFFQECLMKEIQMAGEEQESLSIIFLNVNGFRHLNELYGYRECDIFLRDLSHALMERIHPDDILARYGVDTFVILQPRRHKRQAIRTGEKLKKDIWDLTFYLQGKALKKIALRTGIASFPEDGTGREALIGSGLMSLQMSKEKNEVPAHPRREKKEIGGEG